MIAPDVLVVGDLVWRKDGRHLRSGAAIYETAVVISVEPFALASTTGDMLWYATVTPDEFEALCKAPKSWYEAALRRKKDLP